MIGKMKSVLKAVLLTLPYKPVFFLYNRISENRHASYEEVKSCFAGSPCYMPHRAKCNILRKMQKEASLSTFVETGTYFGDMVWCLRNDFPQIFSIEINDRLCHWAINRFSQNRNVQIIHGDSSMVLPQLLPGIAGDILFWLDGHYSCGVTSRGLKDTPILEELGSILDRGKKNNDIIVIDDAHSFGRDPGYPSLKKIEKYIRDFDMGHQFAIQDDLIIIRK